MANVPRAGRDFSVSMGYIQTQVNRRYVSPCFLTGSGMNLCHERHISDSQVSNV